MHRREIVIYNPSNACPMDIFRKLSAKFPAARWVSKWEDGALMWQEVAQRLEQ